MKLNKIKETCKFIWLVIKGSSLLLGKNIANGIGRLIFPKPYLISYMYLDEHDRQIFSSNIMYFGILRMDVVMERLAPISDTISIIDVHELPRSSCRFLANKWTKYLESQAIDSLEEVKKPLPKKEEEDPDLKEKQEQDELESMLLGK